MMQWALRSILLIWVVSFAIEAHMTHHGKYVSDVHIMPFKCDIHNSFFMIWFVRIIRITPCHLFWAFRLSEGWLFSKMAFFVAFLGTPLSRSSTAKGLVPC